MKNLEGDTSMVSLETSNLHLVPYTEKAPHEESEITSYFLLQVHESNGELTIGRSDPSQGYHPEIDLQKYGSKVSGISREHIKVDCRKKVFTVHPNTKNPTLHKNYKPIRRGEEHPLRSGDYFVIGPVLIYIKFVSSLENDNYPLLCSYPENLITIIKRIENIFNLYRALEIAAQIYLATPELANLAHIIDDILTPEELNLTRSLFFSIENTPSLEIKSKKVASLYERTDSRYWQAQVTPELKRQAEQSRLEREALIRDSEARPVCDPQSRQIGRFIRYEGVFPRVHSVYQTESGEEFYLTHGETP